MTVSPLSEEVGPLIDHLRIPDLGSRTSHSASSSNQWFALISWSVVKERVHRQNEV